MGLQEPKGLCPHACQDTYKRHYFDSSIKHQKQNRTHRINMQNPNMEPKPNMQPMMTPPPPLSGKEAKYVQEVAGTLLYYARAVDSTILPALSVITTKQANLTEKTRATMKHLLDCCATQDKAVLAYKASKTILAVYSDA